MRDIVTKDFGWKLFSVLLALAIWATVKTISNEAPQPDRTDLVANLPVQTFRGLPVLAVSAVADVREFRVQPSAVDVIVEGPTETLRRLADRDIRVTVDLTDIESARGLVKRVEVSMPPGVTLVSATPAEVDVVVPLKRNAPQ